MANETKRICPTCGTRVKEDAERCLVCGSTLSGTKSDAQVVSGAGSSIVREIESAVIIPGEAHEETEDDAVGHALVGAHREAPGPRR